MDVPLEEDGEKISKIGGNDFWYQHCYTLNTLYTSLSLTFFMFIYFQTLIS